MFRIQPSNNKSSSDVPREKYERNKNGGNIVVNSRNPLTCSRSCGVHWLTPEVLLWSRRGVLEEIRNTPRIYVRASFTWYTWCVCMCVCMCEETFATTKPIHGGFRRGCDQFESNANRVNDAIKEKLSPRCMHGNSCGFNTGEEECALVKWNWEGRGGMQIYRVFLNAVVLIWFILGRGILGIFEFWIGEFFVCTEVGLDLRYCIRLFVKFRTFFFGWGIFEFLDWISRNFYLC